MNKRAADTEKRPGVLRGWGKIQGRTTLVGPFRAHSDWGQPYFNVLPHLCCGGESDWMIICESEGINGVFIYLEMDEMLA